MRVIITGAGEIGWYIAEKVSADNHDVTLIDKDENRIRKVSAKLDVQPLLGSAASANVLIRAGVSETDLLVAVTGSDETNIVCGSLARKLGAKRVIARVDEVVYRKAPEISYRDHFGIDELVSPEMLAALELASSVRNPGSLAVEHFARGQLEMQRFTADQDAKNIGKPLCDLPLPDGVRICSINRDGKIIIPRGDDQIAHQDIITIIGKTDHVALARKSFEASHTRPKKVVIMGGGHTTMSLARRLRSLAFRLTIIERDESRCQELAKSLPDTTILNGDATNLSFLKEERIDNADIFISTSSSDEANIMSAIQAKNLGVQKVLVIIHRPDYADLLQKIGIDGSVSPRVVMAQEVLSLLRKSKASTLAKIGDDKAEILELAVEGEDFVGKKLRNIKMPPDSLLLTLQRGFDISVPDADTVFQLGDTVLAICLKDQHKNVVRLIAGQ